MLHRLGLIGGSIAAGFAFAAPAFADKVVVGAYPANPPWEYKTDSGSSRDGSAADRALDGVSVETLSPELAREFDIAGNLKGVLVQRVDPGSAAAEAGRGILASGNALLRKGRIRQGHRGF